jgi:hypothetical protein
MRYEILNDKDEVINTILADAVFVEKKYPGKYRLLEEVIMPIIEVAPVKTLEEKVDELVTKLDALTVSMDAILKATPVEVKP